MAQSSLGSSTYKMRGVNQWSRQEFFEKIRTSTARSPGLSENLNRSYWFAQISASGSTEYDSTAVTLGLFGCRRSSIEK